jgi:hypothetical protein
MEYNGLTAKPYNDAKLRNINGPALKPGTDRRGDNSLEKYRPYHGRKGASRRRRTYTPEDRQNGASRRAVRLYVCIGLFLAAVLVRLLFPATFAGIGEKVNAVVNYKAALETLGEGVSGQKKFISALGEAFTYAFTGQGDTTDSGAGDATVTPADGTASDEDDAVSAFGEQGDAATSEPEAAESPGQSFADAVIAAFMQDQSEFSDYAVPAGVTYAMPRILIDYTTPLAGVVSSPFGYREHPTAGVARFHYGVDIAPKAGTKIKPSPTARSSTRGERYARQIRHHKPRQRRDAVRSLRSGVRIVPDKPSTWSGDRNRRHTATPRIRTCILKSRSTGLRKPRILSAMVLTVAGVRISARRFFSSRRFFIDAALLFWCWRRRPRTRPAPAGVGAVPPARLRRSKSSPGASR